MQGPQGLPAQWGPPKGHTLRPTISLPVTSLNTGGTAGPRHRSKALSPEDKGHTEWVRQHPSASPAWAPVWPLLERTLWVRARQAPRPRTTCHVACTHSSVEGTGNNRQLFLSPTAPRTAWGSQWWTISFSQWPRQPAGDQPQGPLFPPSHCLPQ